MGIRRRFGLMVTSVATVPLVLAGCTAPTSKTEDRADPAAAAAQRAPAPTLALARRPTSPGRADQHRDLHRGPRRQGDRDQGDRRVGRRGGRESTPGRSGHLGAGETVEEQGDLPGRGDRGERRRRQHHRDLQLHHHGQVQPGAYDEHPVLRENRTYGVAMPVVVDFDPPVPEEARAASSGGCCQTEPSQPGAWHWLPTARRSPTGRRSTGSRARRSASARRWTGCRWQRTLRRHRPAAPPAKIGKRSPWTWTTRASRWRSTAAASWTATMPVSLGKPSTPSSSGTMVVMENTSYDRLRHHAASPRRLRVHGQLRPAADLGRGVHPRGALVGRRPGRAQRLARLRQHVDGQRRLAVRDQQVGDPVTVKGTEVQLANGNGWTAGTRPGTTS